MYNHNKAQQSKNRVHISWDILYAGQAISSYRHDSTVMSYRDLIMLCLYMFHRATVVVRLANEREC